jgi:NAD(P)-dependent dehydrogenase (short-subunit alcohol dehydrogenase family)
VARFGRIDAVVHCAAAAPPSDSHPQPLAEFSLVDWQASMDANLRGSFFLLRAVLPIMVKQRRGTIINVVSACGLQGYPLESASSAMQFGVMGLSQSAAEEVKNSGVRVMAIAIDAPASALAEAGNASASAGDPLLAERAADLVLFTLAQPADVALRGAVVAPLTSRKRKKPSGREAPGGTTSS